MKKPLLALASAFVLLVAMSLSVSAAGTTIGPFSGGSPDSGTCGNNWANDTYQWSFSVSALDEGGAGTLTESFVGRFTTVAGMSPGACEPPNDTAAPGNGGTVAADVKGSFSGSETGSLTHATMPDAEALDDAAHDCAAGSSQPDGFTTCRVKAIFGPDAVFTPSTFKFNYYADCGQALVMRHWQNADEASGGNVGDIKSAPGEATTIPCPTPTPTATPTPSASASPTAHPTATPVPTVVALATTGGGTPVDSTSPWQAFAGLGLVVLLIGGGMLFIRRLRRS